MPHYGFNLALWRHIVRLAVVTLGDQHITRLVVQIAYDLMPVNKSELRWFTLGLSVSAGVCKELLFRGFIIGALGDSLGVIVSLILSSLLFGLCHVYQGWMNVVRTGIIGLVLGVIFILTESLWVVIALHALVDIYGGIVGYVLQKPEEQMVE